MWFKNNKLYLVQDIEQVRGKLTNSEFVVVVGNNVYNDFNVFNAGILLPPIATMMKWADNMAPEAMQYDYPMYLSTPEPDAMIVSILALLSTGNVYVVIDNEEMAVYGTALLNHIYYTYGVILETPTTRFAFDVSKLPLVISKFFMNNFMYASEYLASYPVHEPIPEWTMGRVIEELGLYEPGKTHDYYVNAINSFRFPKPVQQPIQMFTEGATNDNIHKQ